MNILYITVQFPVPSETFAAVEIRALQALGAKVAIATLKPRPVDCAPLLRDRNLADLDIDHNSPLSSLRGLWFGLCNPTFLFYLLKEIARSSGHAKSMALKSLLLVPRSLDLFNSIRRRKPDIVHLYWGHYPSLTGILVQEFLPGIPVSLSLSAYDLHSRFGPSITLGRSAPLIFTLAQANVPALRALGIPKDRIHVVYHGIDIEEKTTADRLRSKEGLPAKDGRVVIAERLISLKRTSDSLRVFHKVRDRYPSATLLILGDGPEKEPLIKLAEDMGLGDAIRFLGHVSHAEVFEHFSAAQVFLTMSSTERLPNTVKEAMLRDCVCVVSRTVGIEELISNRKSGFIVEQGEVEAAAAIIVQSLQNWDDLSGLRAKARHHVIDNFSSRAVAMQRIRIWEKALGEKRPGIRADSS
jgi:glycosyltransferase involved in cell wall biosynthesis